MGVETKPNLASLYIDGSWLPPDDNRVLEVRNPADGELLQSVGYGGKTEALAAVDAASRAFESWANTPNRVRADLLITVSERLVQRAEHIALILARETGKRMPEAIAEVHFAGEYFRWFAEQVRRPIGELIPNESPSRRHLTITRGAGVALCLTPWNFPVSIQARKLAPALAAGCTTVSRTSEKAPLALIEVFRCFSDAGIPAGVVNLIQGDSTETTEAMMRHRAVRVVSFTGSTQVGRKVMSQAAEHIVRPLLELGGDAPFIVFEDADLQTASEGALVAKFRNNGQSCIAANRFFVQEGVYDEFLGLFTERVNAMQIGDPVRTPIPDLGPVIDIERKVAIETMAGEAEAAGGKRITASRSLPDRGSFTPPALFVNVPDRTKLSCEEVFGPIAAVFSFQTEEEVIARANDTEMGLAGYVFTGSLSRGWRVAEALQVGILGLNQALPSVAFAPMGGVKQSGLGREGGHQGLEEFLDTKYVSAEI